ncbi:hypothetical protein HYN59_03630 [Flavobacterium album]|uniref:Uncharacterized protein n=1 Tax=Flavobacterium album TaxID=2175091 RepID=A0A2S1QV16_9FLAO|nr:hypothetical protein HYN59_03630 [Flavobacterium album]
MISSPEIELAIFGGKDHYAVEFFRFALFGKFEQQHIALKVVTPAIIRIVDSHKVFTKYKSLVLPQLQRVLPKLMLPLCYKHSARKPVEDIAAPGHTVFPAHQGTTREGKHGKY